MTDMQVELVAVSGDDLLVVNAARASFGKESEWEVAGYTEETDTGSRIVMEWPEYKLSDRDAKLIRYLAREKHVLPFRHPQITLRIKAPIFVCRQLGKHQVGFSWSEESRRYIDSTPEFYWPDKWRRKAENVKQGSSEQEVESMCTSADGYVTTPQDLASAALRHAVFAYEELLHGGVAPEQARMVLPQNMMTTFVWTGSLLGYIQMLKLRLDSHSQKEIRDLAQMIADVIRPLFPVSYAALMGEDDGT